MAPVEVHLGAVADVSDKMYYVPIQKTLHQLLQISDDLIQWAGGHTLQIVLYHDDFQCGNPLGNKVAKLEISGFYFILGNLSTDHV